MTNDEALKIIGSLADGKDPYSQAPLAGESVFNRAETARALNHAAEALRRGQLRERRQESMPLNAGKPWSKEEDARLIEGFENGVSTKVLASEHQRSLAAILARLVKLGKVKEGDWLDGMMVQRPQFDTNFNRGSLT